MFGYGERAQRDKALLTALNASLALIEFDPKGVILDANPNFCRTLGYTLDELVGRHHAIFVDAQTAAQPAYRQFWDKLGRGEFDAGEYLRIGKGGREIWLQASYNPVLNAKAKVERVVKFAADVTQTKQRNAEYEAKLKAISLSQAVIEFTPEGEILDANANFLKTMGYALDEIKGRKHAMFVEPGYAASPQYREFWAKLGRGEFVADLVLRVAKGGRPVQLHASYNPVLDAKGRVVKLVKFAIDVSDLLTLGDSLSRLARRDIEKGIAQEFKPMFAGVRRDFNTAQEALKATMLGFASGIETVSSAASQISAAAENLSGRAEQQAASLEETAAALTTVTDTVRQTAEGSSEATRAVATAKDGAVRGGKVVGQAVEAMDRIEKSSTQIGQIIGVIDEIAFQTNLLALNAGVEAARAGDAGRGFAVVASEVRALAQRSAGAAKEIKGLIQSSTEQVDEGVSLVRETGKELTAIIDQIESIAAQIGQIARAAQEQATALNEIGSAVGQMDQNTQQNAAMAEQTAAAGQSLRDEAGRLAGLVAEFRLGAAEKVDPLRAQLQRAAPHAFAARPPAAPTARAIKVAGSGEDWAEF